MSRTRRQADVANDEAVGRLPLSFLAAIERAAPFSRSKRRRQKCPTAPDAVSLTATHIWLIVAWDLNKPTDEPTRGAHNRQLEGAHGLVKRQPASVMSERLRVDVRGGRISGASGKVPSVRDLDASRPRQAVH